MKLLNRVTGLLIAIALLTYSCKKDDDSPEPDNTDPQKITSPYYFNATINGKQVLFQDGVKFYGNGAGGGGSFGGSDTALFYDYTHFSSFNLADGEAGFGLINTYIDTSTWNTWTPDLDDRKARFKVKTYSFGDEERKIPGANVYYRDKNNTYWSTEYGDQTGSTFQMTKVKDHTKPDGFHLKISAKFSCTLYDEDGNSIKLTGGESTGRVIYY